MAITDSELCALCGKRYAEEEHHLIFGTYGRGLADTDDLVIPVCRMCHRIAEKPKDRLHDNPIAEKLSKIAGQLEWEKNWLVSQSDLGKDAKENARAAFRKRYGKSYL